jgi:ClpP class serine protease
MKELVQEKMEEKGVEFVEKKAGIFKSLKYKRNLTEEQRERDRKNALKCYYKLKSIAVN